MMKGQMPEITIPHPSARRSARATPTRRLQELRQGVHPLHA
jgi:hypothetical protein